MILDKKKKKKSSTFLKIFHFFLIKITIVPKRNVIFTRKHMTKGAKMDFSFREPYG